MANWGGLPAIVSTLPNDVRNFLQRVKETLDGGMAGSSRFVTANELVNGGVATVDPFGRIITTTDTGLLDLSAPPTPTGFIAVGALTTIMLEWKDPLYANFAHAEIWRASVDNQGLAVMIGTSAGVLYADSVDANSSYYYWVRFVSKAGIVGAFTAIAGVHGTTSIDPTALLALLAGEITASQLHADLGTRINLIDAPGTGLVTQSTLIASRLNTGDFAAVKQESFTNANNITGLSAQWTVKIDVGGKVSGFGISSTSPVSGAGTSIFEIRADKIAFAAPMGSPASSIVPFVVDTVNNRVAMDGAYIRNATIGTAQIANLAVDNAKILSVSVNKLTTGSIAVGEYIKSTNYVSGSAGWRINGDGSAELNNIYARGNIRATSFSAITLQTGEHIKQGMSGYATGTGFFIGDDAGVPKFSIGSSSAGVGIIWDGTRLQVAGELLGATGTFTGNLSGAKGTFSGSLSGADITGATGTFTGSLSAGTIDINKLIGTTTVYNVAGTYTLTVPSDKTSVQVTLLGGGGGGGGGGSRSHAGGGGGAGQSITTPFHNLTPGATYTLVVGNGGIGGAGVDYPYVNGTQATPGGATYISGLVGASASGGARGENPFGGGLGGAIGGTNATMVQQGNLFTYTAGNGGSTTYGTGGIGKTTTSSNGGVGAGAHGTGFGSGGAGGSYVGYSGSFGGNGAPGRAVIEFFNPNGVVIRNEYNAFIAQVNGRFSALNALLINAGLTPV